MKVAIGNDKVVNLLCGTTSFELRENRDMLEVYRLVDNDWKFQYALAVNQ